MTCPSFIAAPFIVPSTATICSAVSIWRRSIAFARSSSSRVTLAARVPSCLAPWPAASRPMRAARDQREVGISATLDLGSGHDVVGAVVGPADPGLVAAVVVVAPEDEARLAVPHRARLVTLWVQPAPDADERVVLPLVADGRRVGVARADHRLGRELHELVHDRGPDVGVARAARRLHAADGVLEQRVAGEDLLALDEEVQHPGRVARRVDALHVEAGVRAVGERLGTLDALVGVGEDLRLRIGLAELAELLDVVAV